MAKKRNKKRQRNLNVFESIYTPRDRQVLVDRIERLESAARQPREFDWLQVHVRRDHSRYQSYVASVTFDMDTFRRAWFRQTEREPTRIYDFARHVAHDLARHVENCLIKEFGNMPNGIKV